MRAILALLLFLAATAGCLDEPTDDADRDNDGFSNADEMAAGSDPDDPESTPETVGQDEEEQPDIQTEWSWDSGLGCPGEGTPAVCLAYQNGPGGEGPDGYWIPLGKAYEGMTLGGSINNVRGDSDCYFTDAAGVVVGDAANGASECAGTVPGGSEWVFVYSYAEPHQGLVVTFS